MNIPNAHLRKSGHVDEEDRGEVAAPFGFGNSVDSDSELNLSSSAPHARNRFWESPEPKRSASKQPFMIGVCGGTASGKTTVCDIILKNLAKEHERVTIISLDSFYKALSPEEIEKAHRSEYNFDHPSAFDWVALFEDLLRRGKTATIPVYDFASHSRLPDKGTTIHGSLSDVILMEGILIFHEPKIRDLFDMKLFVDTDADTRLARRVLRDMKERGRSLESVLTQYETFVKPAFDQFIWTTKKYADVVVPRGASNTVAISLIVQHIRHQLQKRAKA